MKRNTSLIAPLLLLVLLSNMAAVAGESANLREWREKADRGDDVAMTDIGVAYINGTNGLARNPEEAVRWFRKAADAGNVFATNNLGICHANGVGVGQSDAEAFGWFKKAAEMGLAKAQWSVGEYYRDGKGVERNFEEAIRWFTMAADQGFAPGFTGVADTYYLMAMEQENPEYLPKVAEWTLEGAKRGDANAQFNMGVMYNNGGAVPKSSEESARWHEKAARNGKAMSQYQLGLFYMEGEGRRRDLGRAKRWLTEALKNGVDKAAAKLAQIPGEVEESPDRPIRLGLTRLLDEYADDAATADVRYLDEILEVVGDNEGGTVNVGGGTVTIIPTDSAIGLHCLLAPSPGGRNINSGPGVIYRGFCRGVVDGHVLLDDCVTLPAEENAKETVGNASAGKADRRAKAAKSLPRNAPPKAKPPARVAGNAAESTTIVDLAGKWAGEAYMDAGGESGEITFDFRKKGSTYTGEFAFDQTSGRITSVEFDGAATKMAGYLILDGERLSVAVSGNVAGDGISGTLEIRVPAGDRAAALRFDVMRAETVEIAEPSVPGPAPKKRGGLTGGISKAEADPGAGVWEGVYVDMNDGEQYRLRIDRDADLELLDEDMRAPVTQYTFTDGLATMNSGWAGDDGTRYDAVFSGAMENGLWEGVVMLTADGKPTFRGSFQLKKIP